MSFSRRRFLRAVPGAVAAAPAMAPAIAASITAPVGLDKSLVLKGEGPADVDPVWARNRIAHLKRQLSGHKTEEERLHEIDVASFRHRIDGLRSVSAVNKSRMVYEEQRRREEERNRFYWLEELDRVSKMIGII